MVATWLQLKYLAHGLVYSKRGFPNTAAQCHPRMVPHHKVFVTGSEEKNAELENKDLETIIPRQCSDNFSFFYTILSTVD